MDILADSILCLVCHYCCKHGGPGISLMTSFKCSSFKSILTWGITGTYGMADVTGSSHMVPQELDQVSWS